MGNSCLSIRSSKVLKRKNQLDSTFHLTLKKTFFFVIDDTYNCQRRLSKNQSVYPDDCGAWDSKKNVTTTKEYIYSNQLLSCVDEKNGLLGRELKKGFVPLQPDPASIVVVKRKYSTLSRHNAYKKRITWFECSLGLTNAVVEYIGDYRTNSTVHDNAKRITAPYIRVNMEQKSHNTGRYKTSETVP